MPIRDEDGVQIGVVSVGLNLDDLAKETENISEIIYYIGIVTLLVGVAGAIVLTRNIKKSIFGLEPAEIATLLKERDVVISSVKEGIVAVDEGGKLLLMNDSAKKLLAVHGDESPSDLSNISALFASNRRSSKGWPPSTRRCILAARRS
jgi:sensor histidine kinase regulating citrate/malate metabolism